MTIPATELLRALGVANSVEAKVELLGELQKVAGSLVKTPFLVDQSCSCAINYSLDDDINVKIAAVILASQIFPLSKRDSLVCELSPRVHSLIYQIVHNIHEIIERLQATQTSEVTTLIDHCKGCITFYSQHIIHQKAAASSLRLTDFHEVLDNIMDIIHYIYTKGSEWSVHFNSRKYTPAEAEILRKSQNSLFSDCTILLQRVISVISETKLDIVSSHFEGECKEMLFICNKLLPICEISASSQDLMDVSWKGFNLITSKYSNALEGKLDVDRVVKCLAFIIQYKFKETLALAPRFKISYEDASKQILPTSDQKAFLGSVKYVRFALVVLVSICKKYGKYISDILPLSLLAVEIRSLLPPAPSSHSLSQSAIEAYATIIPALETIFKVLVVSPSVSETFRWNIIKPFCIISSQHVHHEEHRYALENLQYLNAFLSAPMPLSPTLVHHIHNEAIPWIMNGFQTFTCDILYSSHQLCKVSKTPLYTKTFLALATFLARSSQQGFLSSSLPWILHYSFHPHFLCNLLASELWTFLISHTQDFSLVLQVVEEMIRNLQTKHNATRVSATYLIYTRNFIERSLKSLPESHGAQLFRQFLPLLDISTFDSALFFLCVFPFGYAGPSISLSLTANVVKCCVQRFQEKVTPNYVNAQHIPFLNDVARACYSVLKDEALAVRCDDQKNRLVEIILRLLPFPHVYHSPLASSLILLAIPLRHSFDVEQFITLLDLMLQCIQQNSSGKIPLSYFLSRTADVNIPQHHKLCGQVFDKMKKINLLLLDDSSWLVRHTVKQHIEHYAKFSLFDFRVVIPAKHIPLMLDFLKRKCPPISAEFEYSYLKKEQIAINQTLVQRKRGLPPASQESKKKQKTSPEHQVREGIALIQSALHQLPAQNYQIEKQFMQLQHDILSSLNDTK